MLTLSALKDFCARFAHAEDGTASLEFVIVFPVFFGFFLMTYESGMISARHVMLERGVDIAVRDVRIGSMAAPSRELLRARICEVALIIPDCENQLQVEMIRRNPRSWVAIDPRVQCIDRGAVSQPVIEFTNGENNELIFLKVCVRFDPMLPTTGLGKTIVDNNSSSAAGGSYALVSRAAFVVEPFQVEEE